MNDKDLREKSFFGLNDVFAEVLNAFYRPKDAPPILPEELADAPTEFVSGIRGGGLAHKFRDSLKCLRNEIGINLAFFGLENQTKPDRTMPIRVMGYDWLVYDNQIKQRHGKQKLLPVVTFVVYFGYDKRWDAPRSLRECFEISEDLEPWFADYPIHVIELAWLSDSEIASLGGELKFIAQSLRCIRNRDFACEPQCETKHPDEVLTLLEQITGEPAYGVMREKYQDKEKAAMCEIMEEFRAHYRAEGFEQGEERGKAEGIAIGEKLGKALGMTEKAVKIAKNLLKMQMPQSDIAKATGLSIEEVRQLASCGA